MENPFPNDSYDTPDNAKRFLMDRLFLNSRLFFHFSNYCNFFKTGRLGRKGVLDHERMVERSICNIKTVEGCGGRIHIRGLNNISAVEGPALFVGNHMSFLETVLLNSIIGSRKQFTFVIKDSLLDIPYFGDIMRANRAIGVTRKDPKADFKTVISEGQKLFKEGISIVLFPQATRTVAFEPDKFNTIGIKLAKAAGVPVIPIALKTDFLANGKCLKDLGPLQRDKDIYFEFAPAIREFTGNGKKEHQQIIEFIQAKLSEWK